MNTICAARQVITGIVLVAIAAAVPAYAQNASDISTDRPSFSASPSTVGEGIWQGEFGFLYSDLGDDDKYELPQASLRWGWTHEVEFQLNWAGYTSASLSDSSGINDLSIGVKYQLSDANAPTQFGFLATLSVPIGAGNLSSDTVDPTINFLWSHAGFAGFFGDVQITRISGNYTFTNAIGISFDAGANGGFFVEHVIAIPEKLSSSQNVNIGYAWLRSSALQFDVNGSVGLTGNAADYSIGAGVSMRF